MLAAYVRRGNLLGFMPANEVPEASQRAHDQLMDECPLFWDAILPLEAKEWLVAAEADFKEVPDSHICLPVITHEVATGIVEAWNAHCASAAG